MSLSSSAPANALNWEIGIETGCKPLDPGEFLCMSIIGLLMTSEDRWLSIMGCGGSIVCTICLAEVAELPLALGSPVPSAPESVLKRLNGILRLE